MYLLKDEVFGVEPLTMFISRSFVWRESTEHYHEKVVRLNSMQWSGLATKVAIKLCLGIFALRVNHHFNIVDGTVPSFRSHSENIKNSAKYLHQA